MSNFVVEIKFTSVVFSWSPPQEPNGVIIAYVVSYRSDNQDHSISVDAIVFTSPALLPNTQISNISVRAFTNRGPGASTMWPNVVIPPQPVPRE